MATGAASGGGGNTNRYIELSHNNSNSRYYILDGGYKKWVSYFAFALAPIS